MSACRIYANRKVTELVMEYGFFIDPSRCIGCEACVNACAECETHRGHPMIHVDFIDRKNTIATVPMVCMHCDDPTCAEVCPADAIKKTRRWRRAILAQTSMYRLLQLCSRLPLRNTESDDRDGADDEVRHVLRPDICRQTAHVRDGLPEPGAGLCAARADPRERREKPTNVFHFGNRKGDNESVHDGACRSGCHYYRRRRLHVGAGVMKRTTERRTFAIDEFAIEQPRRLRHAPAVFEVSGSDESRNVRRQSVDSCPKLVSAAQVYRSSRSRCARMNEYRRRRGEAVFISRRLPIACIMIRTAADQVVAYSQKCTHLSCAVYYAKEANRLECPCHEGYFSVTDGSVLQGPPPRALPRILLRARR